MGQTDLAEFWEGTGGPVCIQGERLLRNVILSLPGLGTETLFRLGTEIKMSGTGYPKSSVPRKFLCER